MCDRGRRVRLTLLTTRALARGGFVKPGAASASGPARPGAMACTHNALVRTVANSTNLLTTLMCVGGDRRPLRQQGETRGAPPPAQLAIAAEVRRLRCESWETGLVVRFAPLVPVVRGCDEGTVNGCVALLRARWSSAPAAVIIPPLLALVLLIQVRNRRRQKMRRRRQ